MQREFREDGQVWAREVKEEPELHDFLTSGAKHFLSVRRYLGLAQHLLPPKSDSHSKLLGLVLFRKRIIDTIPQLKMGLLQQQDFRKLPLLYIAAFNIKSRIVLVSDFGCVLCFSK